MTTLLNNKYKLMGLGLCALGMMTACDDEKLMTTDFEEAFPTTEITFACSEELPLGVGMDSTLVFQVGPESATDKTIVFSSSNESVATVSQDGTIHAVSVGDAIISAVPAIGFGANAAVTVHVIPEVIKAQSLTIVNTTDLGDEGKIFVTDEIQLQANILPEDHTYDYITWHSLDESIATVDQNGLVTCLKSGNVTIRAVTHDHSGVYGDYSLTVDDYVEVESLQIAALTEKLCITKGSYALNVTYYPANATVGSVEWSSSDESIATVRRGVVTPTGFGTATITGKTANGNTTSVQVTVDSGWYIWDSTNSWGNWVTASAEYTKNETRMHVIFPATTNKYRADIKYPCDANNPLILDWGNYPVLGMRVTNLATGGNNTIDCVDVLSGLNGNNTKCNTGITLSDGSRLIYYDLSSRYSNAVTNMRVFQIKIADIPMANVTEPWYDIHWIRTFKSVDEMQAFAEAEIAQGN